MASCPEATEENCDFIRILEPADYKNNPEIMRKLINEATARGKSVWIRNYRKFMQGVKFDTKSLEEFLNVWPKTMIDVQGEWLISKNILIC